MTTLSPETRARIERALKHEGCARILAGDYSCPVMDTFDEDVPLPLPVVVVGNIIYHDFRKLGHDPR